MAREKEKRRERVRNIQREREIESAKVWNRARALGIMNYGITEYCRERYRKEL